jgi:hypothetical protein
MLLKASWIFQVLNRQLFLEIRASVVFCSHCAIQLTVLLSWAAVSRGILSNSKIPLRRTFSSQGRPEDRNLVYPFKRGMFTLSLRSVRDTSLLDSWNYSVFFLLAWILTGKFPLPKRGKEGVASAVTYHQPLYVSKEKLRIWAVSARPNVTAQEPKSGHFTCLCTRLLIVTSETFIGTIIRFMFPMQFSRFSRQYPQESEHFPTCLLSNPRIKYDLSKSAVTPNRLRLGACNLFWCRHKRKFHLIQCQYEIVSIEMNGFFVEFDADYAGHRVLAIACYSSRSVIVGTALIPPTNAEFPILL